MTKEFQWKEKQSKIETWITRNSYSKVISIFRPDVLYLCKQTKQHILSICFLFLFTLNRIADKSP